MRYLDKRETEFAGTARRTGSRRKAQSRFSNMRASVCSRCGLFVHIPLTYGMLVLAAGAHLARTPIRGPRLFLASERTHATGLLQSL